MKNTSRHRIIKRSPYQAVLGPISYGLCSFNLPTNAASIIQTEEDLENVIRQLDSDKAVTAEPLDSNDTLSGQTLEKSNEMDAAQLPGTNGMHPAKTIVSSNEVGPEKFPDSNDTRSDEENSNQATENLQTSPQENFMEVDSDCPVCETILNGDTKFCQHCESVIHSKCGTCLDDDFICPLCLRGKTIMQSQAKCFKEQTMAAEKMKKYSDEKFLPMDVGDSVTVKVPSVDRGPLDWPTVGGIILEAKNGLYQIGTKDGVIKNWLPRTSIAISNDTEIQLDAVPRDTFISIR